MTPRPARSASLSPALADPAACRVLAALADGRALPASVVAAEAGLSAAKVGTALDDLAARGLLATVQSGPYRYHRLAEAAAEVAAQACALTPGPPVRSLCPGTRAYEIRLARRCFGHLAGRLGVAVTDALRAAGVVGPDGALTAPGRDRLTGWGLALPGELGATRLCVDWTEQRHHLAGRLGVAILDAFVDAGWVTCSPTSRALAVTGPGADALRDRLCIAWPPHP